MTGCDYPRELLQAWLDGEAGKRAAQTRDHLEHCRDCAHEVDSWRRAGDGLRHLVDDGIGEVEPLVALEKIRNRIAEAESRTFGARLRRWWQETWLLNRRALAGVAVAAALGALTAPAAVFLAGRTSIENGNGTLAPAVVVESLEVGNNATAVVLGGEGGSTTLIWVEPGSNNGYSETF